MATVHLTEPTMKQTAGTKMKDKILILTLLLLLVFMTSCTSKSNKKDDTDVPGSTEDGGNSQGSFDLPLDEF